MGHMVCHLGEHLRVELQGVLAIFLERLKNEITRLTAVRTLSLIAASPLKVQCDFTRHKQSLFCSSHEPKKTNLMLLFFFFFFSMSCRSTCHPSCQTLYQCWDLSWGRTRELWSLARWRAWPRWSHIMLQASNPQHWSLCCVNFLLWWMRVTCTSHRYCFQSNKESNRGIIIYTKFQISGNLKSTTDLCHFIFWHFATCRA